MGLIRCGIIMFRKTASFFQNRKWLSFGGFVIVAELEDEVGPGTSAALETYLLEGIDGLHLYSPVLKWLPVETAARNPRMTS